MNSKPGKLILIAFVIFVIITLVAVVPNLAPSDDIQSLADTRAGLRAQGAKTDLTDFDLTSSGDPRARAMTSTPSATRSSPPSNPSRSTSCPWRYRIVAAAWKLDYASSRTTNAPWSTV